MYWCQSYLPLCFATLQYEVFICQFTHFMSRLLSFMDGMDSNAVRFQLDLTFELLFIGVFSCFAQEKAQSDYNVDNIRTVVGAFKSFTVLSFHRDQCNNSSHNRLISLYDHQDIATSRDGYDYGTFMDE